MPLPVFECETLLLSVIPGIVVVNLLVVKILLSCPMAVA